MNAQAWTVALIGVAAVGWLVWRFVRRRGAGTCCGEKTCPAAEKLLDRLRE